MTDSPAFSVIIPVYNNWKLTENCLKSLREHTLEHPFEVIVADNASSDATPTELPKLGAALFGEAFKYLRYEENRNFGPASNAGARMATAPLLFFLNNDTLLTPGWAPPLLQALEADPTLGGVGPLLLYPDNTVQHLGVHFSETHVGHLYQYFPAAHAVVKKRRKFQAITAAAFLTPAKYFFDHGGFFEGFRNGFEDVDLCLHMRKNGFTFTCVPESVVYHLESQTPGRTAATNDNVSLLTERCWDLRHCDLHTLGMADGFVATIDDCLEISLVMSETDEQALLRMASGKDGGFWLELIRQNPFWRSGLRFLAEQCERQGDFSNALQLRHELFRVCASIENAKALFRCAVNMKDATVRRRTEQSLQEMYAYRENRARTERRVNGILKSALPDDTVLPSLYAAKLASMFAPKPKGA
jgi:GT2 family glycosyltransferase